ncbi:hypothetical protein ABT297_17590 [Dactylosporangium sp. NPDC000555]|uniref:hypothetical protein n=1 Tax=Dactylosporangium sp. NPDC000555 TaxID=3154260 RepID=UPI00332CE300
MVKSVKMLADRVLERIVPSADAQAACLSCDGPSCVYKCCVQGARVDWYRCCFEHTGCKCTNVGYC